MSLYPHQERALEAYDRAARHSRRVLLVAPTGAGKTRIAREIIRRRGNPRTLFLAPWRVLIPQTAAKFTADDAPLTDDDVGLLMSGRKLRAERPVQVGSIETVRQWLDRLDDVQPELVIVDEAHRAATDLRRAMLEHFDQADHVLLSATPFRGKAGGLRPIADDLVVVANTAELIDDGYLTPFRHFAADPSRTNGVPIVEHDFDPAELAARMKRPRIVGDVVEQWHDHAKGRPTLCFSVNVDHSMELVRGFTDAGVAAEHLDSNTPVRERDAILDRLREGTTRIVSNCNVLTEGFDEPSVSCVILRPTKSLSVYIQQAGRGLRLFDGKEHCVLLDPGGNAFRFGLVDRTHAYDLDAGVKDPPLQGDLELIEVVEGEPIPVEDVPVSCEMCSTLMPARIRSCPTCGWFDLRPDRLPPRIEGDLEELDTEIDDRELWRHVQIGRSTGYGVYWAAMEYKTANGHAPVGAGLRRQVMRELEELAEANGHGADWKRGKMRALYG